MQREGFATHTMVAASEDRKMGSATTVQNTRLPASIAVAVEMQLLRTTISELCTSFPTEYPLGRSRAALLCRPETRSYRRWCGCPTDKTRHVTWYVPAPPGRTAIVI